MPKIESIKKVLVIGSGPIVIGQAKQNLTMPEHRHAVLLKRKELR